MPGKKTSKESKERMLLEPVAAPFTMETSMPPVIFSSILMSMMASRFLFNPVMKQVQPLELAELSNEKYADIISAIFSHGIESVYHTKI